MFPKIYPDSFADKACSYLGAEWVFCFSANSKELLHHIYTEFGPNVRVHLETVIHGATGLQKKPQKQQKFKPHLSPSTGVKLNQMYITV